MPVAAFLFYVIVGLLPGFLPAEATADVARLEIVLQKWQTAASRSEYVECQFVLFKYDRTFGLEQRGRGWLAANQQGQASYRVEPLPIGTGERSQKRGPDGDRFTLQPAAPTRLHWTEHTLLCIDDEHGFYWELPRRNTQASQDFHPAAPVLPQEDDHDTTSRSPQFEPAHSVREAQLRKQRQARLLRRPGGRAVSEPGQPIHAWDLWTVSEPCPLAHPFLLGTPLAELKQRFQISLFKEDRNQAWVRFTPLTDDCSFTSAILILNCDDWRPVAVKMIDPLNNETVHVISDFRTTPGILEVDPLDRPRLEGYRRS